MSSEPLRLKVISTQHDVFGNIKVKVARVLLLMERTPAMGCHLSYGITQCYLSADTSEHIQPGGAQMVDLLHLKIICSENVTIL